MAGKCALVLEAGLDEFIAQNNKCVSVTKDIDDMVNVNSEFNDADSLTDDFNSCFEEHYIAYNVDSNNTRADMLHKHTIEDKDFINFANTPEFKEVEQQVDQHLFESTK